MLVFGFPISVSRDLRPQVAYPIRLHGVPCVVGDSYGETGHIGNAKAGTDSKA